MLNKLSTGSAASLCCAPLGLAIALLVSPRSAAQERIEWHAGTRTFDAHVQAWPLQKVLAEVARETRWHVFVDADAESTVSSRFERLPTAEALRRLLGDLNFSLSPVSNGVTELFVFRTSVGDARHRVHPAPGTDTTDPGRLRDELVVRLRPGSGQGIDALAARVGARVVGRLDELNAYRLRFGDSSAADAAQETLEAMEDVASVESNYSVSPPSRIDPAAPAGAPPLGLKPKVVSSSEQIVVALIDTALSPSSTQLKDFLLPAVSVSGSAEAVPGQLTHGTAMAEILLRALASQSRGATESAVRLLPVDVYGGMEVTSTFDIVRGLYAAAAQGPDVINLSLGGSGESPLLREAVQALRKSDVLLFAAPGNEPTTALVYPAAYPEVNAVTASDREGRLAPYASRGDFVDLIAPGTGVVHLDGQSFLVTGTSSSTARMSGTAAALLARSGATPAQVLSSLREQFAFQPVSTSGP